MSNDLSGKTHTAVSGSDGSTAYINMAYSMAALRGEVDKPPADPTADEVLQEFLFGGRPRPIDSRIRLLQAAIEVIDEQGDAALRVVKVAERAGVATGLINHHFGGRDGLIAAAQAVRYSKFVSGDLNILSNLRYDATGPEIHAALLELAQMILDIRLAERRLARASAIGAAHGREELREIVGTATTELMDRLTHLVKVGQQIGFFRTDLSARSVATLIASIGFGLVLADLDAKRPTDDQLLETLMVALSTFLLETAAENNHLHKVSV